MKFILFPDFERFKGFLETALQKMEEPEKSFVIMDNASYHSKLVISVLLSVFSFSLFLFLILSNATERRCAK